MTNFIPYSVHILSSWIGAKDDEEDKSDEQLDTARTLAEKLANKSVLAGSLSAPLKERRAPDAEAIKPPYQIS